MSRILLGIVSIILPICSTGMFSIVDLTLELLVAFVGNILLNCFDSELSVEQVEYIFYRIDVGASWRNAVHFYSQFFHFFSSSRGVLWRIAVLNKHFSRWVATAAKQFPKPPFNEIGKIRAIHFFELFAEIYTFAVWYRDHEMRYFTAATYFFAFQCAALLQAFISLSPNSSCRCPSLVSRICFVHKTADIKIEAYLLGPNVLWIIFYHATSKSKSACQIVAWEQSLASTQ